MQPQALGLLEPVAKERMKTSNTGKRHGEEVSHLVSSCLILFLSVCVRVWLHMEVPAIKLHYVPIFYM